MSNLYEYIKMAVHNIMANKGRSFLTMLGIIIGIASVIAIVSVGEGTKNQMNSEIDDIGGGQIAISVSDEAQTDEEWITADDVEAIRAVDGIELVNVSDSFSGETTTGKGNFSLMLTGEGPDAKLLNNATMKHGVYFGENEVQEAKNVCVLSDADAKRLFGTDDVVGMTVDVNCYGLTKSLRICGVTTQKENGTFVSYTYDGKKTSVCRKRLLSGTELSGYYELYESDAGYGDCFYLLCGGNFPSGWRYRRYEYYAGFRNRTYQRDWYP